MNCKATLGYAFILCFDNDVESKFQNIIELIAESGISNYVTDTKIPPHISIAAFTTDNVDPIISKLDGHISDFKPGNIVWPSLGMFVPNVLFFAPVLNEYLLNACININRLIEPLSTVGERGMYLPYNWIPHTTLASKLDNDGLKKAIDITVKRFSFVAGKSNRLILVKSDPYEEIRTWDLV